MTYLFFGSDSERIKMYLKNFGEFFGDQVESAGCLVLSRTAGLAQEKLDECLALLKEHNAKATVITTPWDELTGEQIAAAMQRTETLEGEMEKLLREIGFSSIKVYSSFNKDFAIDNKSETLLYECTL